MAFFISRFDNKVDKKGRVSVPASFRAELATQPFAGIVAFPSPVLNAIEACGMDRLKEMAAHLDTMNPYGGNRNAFANAMLTKSHQLTFDSEGRVGLPERLLKHAGISAMATFAGTGPTFQIWNPDTYEEFEREAEAQASEMAARGELPWYKPVGDAAQ